MNMDELSGPEIKLIESQRKEAADRSRANAFYRVSVILAAQWQEFALQEGSGLTYSEFIDNFDVGLRVEELAKEHGLEASLHDWKPKPFYEAVKHILEASADFTNKLFGLK
jgi:hypothetical protein